MSPPVQEVEPEKDIAIIEMGFEPDSSLPRAIVLDLSLVNFLDTVGVKTLCRVRIWQSHLLVHTHTKRERIYNN